MNKPDSKSIEDILEKLADVLVTRPWLGDEFKNSLDQATAQLNRLLEEARIAELEEVWRGFENSGIELSNRTINFEKFLQARILELKKDKQHE